VRLGHVAELRFAGGVAEQQSKTVGVGGGRAGEGREAGFVEVVCPDRLAHPVTSTMEYFAVEVGL
jgi:hypothetical protein